MPTPTLEELLGMQSEKLKATKTYADSLRDRRSNWDKNLTSSLPAFDNSNGQVNPVDNFNLLQQFLKAGQGYVAPVAEASLQEDDLLQKMIGNLSAIEKSKTDGSKEPTYSERLAAMKEGYDIKDGQFVPIKSGMTDVISKVKDTSARGKAAEYVAYLKDLKGLASKISGSGFIGDMMSGTTGPLAQFQGAYGDKGQFRTDLDALSSKVKNKVYGAAISEMEMKDANKWLPGTAKQETENSKRINTQIETKTNELTSLLRGQGLSEDEINVYLDQMQIGKNQVNQDKFSSFRSQLQQGEVLYVAPNGDVIAVPKGEEVPQGYIEL